MDVGYYGGNANTVAAVAYITSWQECSSLCYSNGKCYGWTYYTSAQTKYPSYRNWCYLKDATFVNFRTSEDGLISGEKSCYAGKVKCDFYNGEIYSKIQSFKVGV